MNSAFQSLLQCLCDPAEVWQQDSYTFDNHARGIQIWTGNGFLSLNTYPEEIRLSLFNKWQLSRAIKIAGANAIARKCSTP
jgi:hypothetical protein